MGKIKKLHQGALVGEGSSEEVYPVTAAQAVYHSNGSDLETLIDMRDPVSVSQDAGTGKTTITVGSDSYDVATEPVSVSQNSQTGKTELKIGGDVAFTVDKEPEAGSNNLVESGGVKKQLELSPNKVEQLVLSQSSEFSVKNGYYDTSDGHFVEHSSYRSTELIPLYKGEKIKPNFVVPSNAQFTILFFDATKTYLSYEPARNQDANGYFKVTNGTQYIAITYYYTLNDGGVSITIAFNDNIVDIANELNITPSARRKFNTIIGYYDENNGNRVDVSFSNYHCVPYLIKVEPKDIILFSNFDSSVVNIVCFYDENKNFIGVRKTVAFVGNSIDVIDSAYYVSYCVNKNVQNIEIEVISNNIKPSEYIRSNWNNKKIAWYGTSIPAGYPKQSNQNTYAYPNLIAQKLGAVILNYCVPGGVIRSKKTNGSALPSDYSSVIFTDVNCAINYQDNLLSLIGTANEPDLFVFDYGVNDIAVDKSEFQSDIDYSEENLNTFIGSYVYVLKRLFALKPTARVLFLTHFSDDGIAQSGAGYGKNTWKAMNDNIVGLAEYWGIKYIDARHMVGWFNTKTTTTDENGIENLSSWVYDGIHPASGTDQQAKKSVDLLADLYYAIVRNYK